MSVHAFAEHLGVSDRMVSKWEAGGDEIYPRAGNQAALDTSLAMAGPEVRARFERMVADRAVRIERLSLAADARGLYGTRSMASS